MTLPLFVYGSLRDPRVRRRLLGERACLTTRPARLHGHARLTFFQFGYPVVVPAGADDHVDGELLLGLSAADLAVLDVYEDVDEGLYVRAQVAVRPLDGVTVSAGDEDVEPETIAAWTYLKGPSAPA